MGGGGAEALVWFTHHQPLSDPGLTNICDTPGLPWVGRARAVRPWRG